MGFDNVIRAFVLLVLFVMSVGCSSGQKKPSAVSVQVSGTGSSCDIAIQNARQNAVEKVTGTLLHGKRLLVDSDYSESISEFSGGTIKKSDVISVDQGNPCRVKIAAEIEPGNLYISEPYSQRFDLNQVSLKNRKIEESKLRVAELINRPDLIRLEFNFLRWESNPAGSTKISYQITELKPTSGWYSDLEDFFKVQGVLVEYRVGSNKQSIFEMLSKIGNDAQYYASVESFSQDDEICFASDSYAVIRCYKSTVATDAMRILDSIYLNQRVLDQNDRVISMDQIKPLGFSLYSRRGFSEKYISRQGVSHVFNLVEPNALPVIANSTLSSPVLGDGSSLDLSLEFKTRK